MIELFTHDFQTIFILNFYQFFHFACPQRIFIKLFHHFWNISFRNSWINDSNYPHKIHKANFSRKIAFNLIMISFVIDDLIDNFPFKLVKAFAERTAKRLLALSLSVLNACHMIPSKTTITPNHSIIRVLICTNTIRRVLMLRTWYKRISTASYTFWIFL